jgi:hypothetical protein
MSSSEGNLASIRTWIGPDLWPIVLKGWREKQSRDWLAAAVENRLQTQNLPPALREVATDQVASAIRKLEGERQNVRASRSGLRPISFRQASFRSDLEEKLEHELLGNIRRFKVGRQIARARVRLVGRDTDVGADLIPDWTGPMCIPSYRLYVRLRAGWEDRIAARGLAAAGRRINLELRPVATTNPDVEAFAATWVSFSLDRAFTIGHIRQRTGFLFRNQVTGAVRYGSTLEGAHADVTLTRAETLSFLRRALEPLRRLDRQHLGCSLQRRSSLGQNRRLPPMVAEEYRAHLIWIANHAGGEVGKLFRAAALKGYMPLPEPRGEASFRIGPIDGTWPGSLARPAQDLLHALDRAPERSITDTGTAHERLAAKLFRKRHGIAGAEIRLLDFPLVSCPPASDSRPRRGSG